MFYDTKITFATVSHINSYIQVISSWFKHNISFSDACVNTYTVKGTRHYKDATMPSPYLEYKVIIDMHTHIHAIMAIVLAHRWTEGN